MLRRALAFLLVLPWPAAAAEPRTSPARLETMSGVAENLAFIDEVLKRVGELAEDARDEKDLSKLVCVDEKLHAVAQLAGIAKQANADLLSSMAEEDEAATDANAAKIAIARLRAEALRDEAARCMGTLLYRSGDTTSVEVREPTGLPGAGTPRERLGVVRRMERPEEGSPLVNPDAAPDADTVGR